MNNSLVAKTSNNFFDLINNYEKEIANDESNLKNGYNAVFKLSNRIIILRHGITGQTHRIFINGFKDKYELYTKETDNIDYHININDYPLDLPFNILIKPSSILIKTVLIVNNIDLVVFKKINFKLDPNNYIKYLTNLNKHTNEICKTCEYILENQELIKNIYKIKATYLKNTRFTKQVNLKFIATSDLSKLKLIKERLKHPSIISDNKLNIAYKNNSNLYIFVGKLKNIKPDNNIELQYCDKLSKIASKTDINTRLIKTIIPEEFDYIFNKDYLEYSLNYQKEWNINNWFKKSKFYSINNNILISSDYHKNRILNFNKKYNFYYNQNSIKYLNINENEIVDGIQFNHKITYSFKYKSEKYLLQSYVDLNKSIRLRVFEVLNNIESDEDLLLLKNKNICKLQNLLKLINNHTINRYYFIIHHILDLDKYGNSKKYIIINSQKASKINKAIENLNYNISDPILYKSIKGLYGNSIAADNVPLSKLIHDDISRDNTGYIIPKLVKDNFNYRYMHLHNTYSGQKLISTKKYILFILTHKKHKLKQLEKMQFDYRLNIIENL